MPEPLTIALVAAAGYAALGESEVSNPNGFANPFNETHNLWPLPTYIDPTSKRHYEAEISDGFGSGRMDALDDKPRIHKGVDIMYRRKSSTDKVDVFPVGSHTGSKGYFIPEPFNPRLKWTPVLAIADGILWSAGEQGRGFAVVIDHGKPWASFYLHLKNPTVPATSKGTGARMIRRGDVIGYVGFNPVQGEHALQHLHFELWRGGAGDSAIDPAAMMRTWMRYVPAIEASGTDHDYGKPVSNS